ncbi:hypothetical protein SMA90_28355, partial [Escherichia coli]
MYTDMLYQYKRDLGNGQWANMVNSQSNVHTFFTQAEGEWYTDKWMFSANLSLNQHFVRTADNAVVSVEGQQALVGYEQARLELSVFSSVKYRPAERLGFTLNLRDDVYGENLTPLIPSFFAEYLLSKKGELVL